jgi:dipeptidyl aminopeptidase/acylaminoacyl peptidase
MGASAISHDNRRIAVISARDGPPRLSVLPMSGGAVRTFATRRAIAPVNGTAMPQWSPDDRYVAVPTGNFDKLVSHRNAAGIDVIEVATSRVVTLDIDHELARYAWSPDSRAIRYVHQQAPDSTDPRPMQIREASLQGGNRVVRELARSAGAMTFQDFDHLYSREDGTLIDLRTGAARMLVPPSEFPEPYIVPALPCFSPNGEWMALPTSAAGRGPYNRIKLVAVRSGEQRILDPGFRIMGPGNVQCHPDNRHLIVTGRDSSDAPLRMELVGIADGSRRPITESDDDVVGVGQFAVAPDGKTIVVSRRQPPLPLKLVRFDAREG